MYLEPWQVFAGGCVIGTLISFIVLATFIGRFLYKFDIGRINITKSSNTNEDDPADLITKLSFILYHEGLLSDNDIEFLSGKISVEAWKKALEEELDEHDSDKD